MRVTIVGGGLIGSGIAWRLAQQGVQVTVVDAGHHCAASSVGAGLLIPAGGRISLHHLALKKASAELFPSFVAELQDLTALSCELRDQGTLNVYSGPGGHRSIEGMSGCLKGLGIYHEVLDRKACLALEPSIGSSVEWGYFTKDRSVNPVALLTALRKACELAGVNFFRDSVSSFVSGKVALRSGESLESDQIVVANGAWLAELTKLPVFPVKGEVVLLKMNRPIVRNHLSVQKESLYFVPRGTAQMVIGATEEEVGFEEQVTATDSLRDRAIKIVPAVGELEIITTKVGFRPKVGDGLPLLGPVEDFVVAGGHYRNGILLTPITSQLVCEYICEGRVAPLMKPFLPARDLRDKRQ